MLPDHYATLGVAPNAPRAVIRAAYLHLMRRFHPDRNSSAAAAAQARAITAAYAVLSAPDKRARYDFKRARVGAAASSIFTSEQSRRRLTPWFPVLFGIPAILLLVPLLVPGPLIPPEAPSQSRSIGGRQTAASAVPIQPTVTSNLGALCSSPTASGLIKRELFRRAALLRGSNSAAFDRIAGYSLVRFDSPVVVKADSGAGAVNCKASVTLDLPPGVAVYGGRRSLIGRIGYSLQTADIGGGSISFTNEEAITELLATLAPTSTQAALAVDASADPNERPRVDRPPLVERATSAAPSPLAQPAPPPELPAASLATRVEPQRPVVQQNPSFSCRVARSWAAITVCRSASLAALDRDIASRYGNAMEQADAAKRALLQRSDSQFLARRDGCSSEVCVHGAYLARIREIQDIMAGTPPR